MSQSVFEITNLQVNYGLKTAVQGVSLSLQAGQCLGLLGANGAGKSTTIKALLGMLKPKLGEVRVFGDLPRKPKVLRRLGFAPEEGLPPDFLSGEEYLNCVGAFKFEDRAACREQVKEMLEYFELDPKKRIRDYSKGMKRRLLLSQSMLGRPEFLVLDEPLNGLDPLIIIKLRDRIEAFRKAGGSVLYSSHILTEVEKSCTHIAIIDGGTLLLVGSIEEVLRDYGSVEGAFAKHVARKN